MAISALTSGQKWPYLLIALAVFMLAFAGSHYSHSPGHQHIHADDKHATGKAPSAPEHQHIQLSGDNQLGVDSLLHCGADILGDGGLKSMNASNRRKPKYARCHNVLVAHLSTQDPPPPRFTF